MPFFPREAAITSHTERSCTTSAAFPTGHQPPVDANSSSKSKVANTTTTLFGPSSTLPTFFSHERDSVLHLDLSARRQPVLLLIALSLQSSATALSHSSPANLPAGAKVIRVKTQVKTQVGATVLYLYYNDFKASISSLPTLLEPIISASVYYLADGRTVSLQRNN